MDRNLDALVSVDVAADLVRVDIRGRLDRQTRPGLINIISRVRRMGIRSHISVDLSAADLVESAALAGLRSDLNAVDALDLPGLHGAGVSIETAPRADTATAAQVLTLDGGGLPDGDVHTPAGLPSDTDTYLDELSGRPLADYTEPELLAASDALFSLLDNPDALAGADLLGRYNDIGRELLRRQQPARDHWPSDTTDSVPAAGDQAAS